MKNIISICGAILAGVIVTILLPIILDMTLFISVLTGLLVIVILIPSKKDHKTASEKAATLH